SATTIGEVGWPSRNGASLRTPSRSRKTALVDVAKLLETFRFRAIEKRDQKCLWIGAPTHVDAAAVARGPFSAAFVGEKLAVVTLRTALRAGAHHTQTSRVRSI